MLLNGVILFVVVLCGATLAFSKSASSPVWRATITPLASIIGSGFLVLGPILVTAYGMFAPLVMGILCAGAYLFGGAIRFNIATIEQDRNARPSIEIKLDQIASWSLGFAYMVSVAYYLNLFGAFGVNVTPFDDKFHANLLTSFMLLVILGVGWTRGFSGLEVMERIAVGLKLAIIAGLLVGLSMFFVDSVSADALILNPVQLTGLPSIALAFGLIVTVQGFETSRYLGADYDAMTRIQSMRRAQWVATVIYIIYIGLISFLFDRSTLSLKETAVIDMMLIVAAILPSLLVVAALSAQFSAAVADTSGSGGLIAELTNGRVNAKQSYGLLVLFGLILTWSSDVFEIVSYASRAFAAYYALQSLIATISALRTKAPTSNVLLYTALTLLGVLATVFGTSVED